MSMKPLTACALALLLPASAMFAATAKKPGVTISFSSDDSRTHFGPRHSPGDARLAITSRDGSTMLLLLNDSVAVQLTDLALKDTDTKKETTFLEDLLVSAVRLTVGKSVEYPIANIRVADVSNGELRLLTDKDKPVFSELKVNGTEVFRDFTAADAARFVNALRAAKARR